MLAAFIGTLSSRNANWRRTICQYSSLAGGVAAKRADISASAAVAVGTSAAARCKNERRDDCSITRAPPDEIVANFACIGFGLASLNLRLKCGNRLPVHAQDGFALVSFGKHALISDELLA